MTPLGGLPQRQRLIDRARPRASHCGKDTREPEHFDVLTIGRVGIDLYPLQDNVGLEACRDVLQVPRRQRHECGDRRGQTRSSDRGDHPDRSGRVRSLRARGVDAAGRLRPVTSPRCPDLLTPLAFCENYPPDHFPLQFYRLPIAPDLVIRPEELDLAAIADAADLLVDGDRAVARAEPRGAPRGLAGAGAASRTPSWIWTTGDVFWDGQGAGERAGAGGPAAGHRRDRQQGGMRGRGRRDRAAPGRRGAAGRRRRDRHRQAGAEGRARHDQRRRWSRCRPPRSRRSTVSVPATASAARSATDCCPGWDLERILRFANAAGAIVATRRECSTAMPTTDEVELLLEEVRTCLTRPSRPDTGRTPAQRSRGRHATGHKYDAITQDPGHRPGAIQRAADARTKAPVVAAGRPADDHCLRPPGPRRERGRQPPVGHGQPRRSARAAADRAVAPGGRRAARQPGHHRGPAAAGRAGGQGRVRVDEPRWPAGRGLRARRPVHRLRRPGHRRPGIQRRQDPDPGRAGRPRHAAHLDRHRQAINELAERRPDGDGRAVLVVPGGRQGAQRPVRRTP